MNLIGTKANQSTTYTKTDVDNNLILKADKATTYTNAGTDNSLDTKQIRFILDEISLTNTNRSFDHGDNKFRAINVTSPSSIQTTSSAYEAINADCYTKSEVSNSLASKRNF